MRARGFTLIEIVMTMALAAIVMLTSGLLIQSGYRSWNRSFKSANSESRLGSLDAMTALGAIGRKSNKESYVIYHVSDNGNTFTKLVPNANPEEILTGGAAEFRYWDGRLTPDLMNPAVKATAYALFYLDNGVLKIDCGTFPPGAVDASGHRRTPDKSTVTLAENVTLLEFSHTTKNMAGDGRGCVRMKLVITTDDPNTHTHESKTTLSAVFMRNVWP